jgi:hypothetical protein
MAYNRHKGCVICAWRGSCAKKFSIDEGGLHCPDYTEDVQLRRQLQVEAAAVTTEKDNV